MVLNSDTIDILRNTDITVYKLYLLQNYDQFAKWVATYSPHTMIMKYFIERVNVYKPSNTV